MGDQHLECKSLPMPYDDRPGFGGRTAVLLDLRQTCTQICTLLPKVLRASM